MDFEAVYIEHWARTCRFVRRLGIPEKGVEDVVQETFLVAHRRLSEYQPDRPFLPWLFTIGWGCATEYRRRAVNRREQVTGDPPGEHASQLPSPEDRTFAGEDQRRVAAALAELPTKLRDIVILHDLEGFSTGESAKILRLTEDQVSGRLRQAHSRLKAIVPALSDLKNQVTDHLSELLRNRREFLHSIADLPCPMRDVLVLIDIEGAHRSQAETALDLPSEEIDACLQRARAEVADRLRRATETPDLTRVPTAKKDAARRDLLLRGLEELPAPERDAFVVHHIEGLSKDDAAVIVGQTARDFEATLKRAELALPAIVRDLNERGGGL